MQEISEINSDSKAILSNFINNGRRLNKNGVPVKLSGNQKLDLISIASCFNYIENFNPEKYKQYIKNGEFILDMDLLHEDVYNAILSKSGLTPEEISLIKPENKAWNKSYISLLMRSVPKDQGEIADVIRAASMGNFKDYILDESNIYGQTNLQTKNIFIKNGANYSQWLNPDINDVEFEVAGKKLKIRMWDRNPLEDMFLGSKTSCCAALDRTNGGSMAIYMLNTSYNVVELYDSNNNVVGMSRIFMATIDGKPTLIMDNIELNKTFIKDMDFETDIKNIRDNFFKYMNNFAKTLTDGQDVQVLFYSGDVHVPTTDLPNTTKTTTFMGKIHREDVYVNSAYCKYINPENLDQEKILWLKTVQNE